MISFTLMIEINNNVRAMNNIGMCADMDSELCDRSVGHNGDTLASSAGV